MNSLKQALVQFFGVPFRGSTYLNALYLLLAFPLGLFYLIFLITGISLGVPLTIVWVGFIILIGVYAAWNGLIAFERIMAIGLLGEEIPPISRQDLSGKDLWQKFTATLSNPVTWKGLLFLLAKFPLGLVSFIVLVTLLSISGSLVAAPFYYQWVNPQIHLTIDGFHYMPVWIIDTLPEALLVCLAGVLISLVSMHILNGLSWVSGKFARVMLGNFSKAPAAPASPAAPIAPDTSASAPSFS